MIGRPTDYSQDLVSLICDRIAQGESLRSICRDPEMPAMSSVFLWLTKYAAFSEQYAHAREAQADTLADELIDICDDATNDWMERRNAKGEACGLQADQEHINRSRLRVETRKWIASKLKPKKYGDRLSVDSTVRHSADAFTDDQLAHIASTGSDGITEAPSSQKEPSGLH